MRGKGAGLPKAKSRRAALPPRGRQSAIRQRRAGIGCGSLPKDRLRHAAFPPRGRVESSVLRMGRHRHSGPAKQAKPASRPRGRAERHPPKTGRHRLRQLAQGQIAPCRFSAPWQGRKQRAKDGPASPQRPGKTGQTGKPAPWQGRAPSAKDGPA